MGPAVSAAPATGCDVLIQSEDRCGCTGFVDVGLPPDQNPGSIWGGCGERPGAGGRRGTGRSRRLGGHPDRRRDPTLQRCAAKALFCAVLLLARKLPFTSWTPTPNVRDSA